MDFYTLLIFVHVLGGVSVFGALGVEVAALRSLSRADTITEARTSMAILDEVGSFAHVAMITVLVTGVWMMAARWGPEPWVLMALAALVAMGILGAVLTLPAMVRLEAALAVGSGAVPGNSGGLVGGPLRASLWFRVGLAVGIVGLMTTKPGLAASFVIIGTAAVGSFGAISARRFATHFRRFKVGGDIE